MRSGTPLLRSATVLAAVLAAVLVAPLVLACGTRGGDASPARRDTAAPAAAAPAPGDTVARRITIVEGFDVPEGTRWDPVDDVWYVSNIVGNPAAKDGNGFISRLRSDGTLDSLHFIWGGHKGVTLNAPKGMALQGDTLWVADIDAVRSFDRRTGAPIASVDLSPQGATFLNDIATGGDGAVYVTDMALATGPGGESQHPVPDRVFRVAGGRGTVALETDSLARPNGIAWDSTSGRFVIVPFMGRTIRAWTPAETVTHPIGTGPGMQDGVEVLPDGRVLASSWADSTIFVVDGNSPRPLIRGVGSPADFGLDRRRLRVLIPILAANRVELWEVPRR